MNLGWCFEDVRTNPLPEVETDRITYSPSASPLKEPVDPIQANLPLTQ